jgi:dihydrofolate reductase
MVVSAVVAASQNGVIGRQGSLPWNLPGEMAYFKKITMGHPIIMGRKTHESIGRALPGRQNIIITHDGSYKAEGCTVVTSLDKALEAAAAADIDEVFIIGGSSIYELAMPKLNKIYLTRILADIEGDKFFKPSLRHSVCHGPAINPAERR